MFCQCVWASSKSNASPEFFWKRLTIYLAQSKIAFSGKANQTEFWLLICLWSAVKRKGDLEECPELLQQALSTLSPRKRANNSGKAHQESHTYCPRKPAEDARTPVPYYDIVSFYFWSPLSVEVGEKSAATLCERRTLTSCARNCRWEIDLDCGRQFGGCGRPSTQSATECN